MAEVVEDGVAMILTQTPTRCLCGQMELFETNPLLTTNPVSLPIKTGLRRILEEIPRPCHVRYPLLPPQQGMQRNALRWSVWLGLPLLASASEDHRILSTLIIYSGP